MKKCIFLLFVIARGAVLHAQDIISDTARIYRSSEVVITATRSAILKQDSPAPTELLDSNDIRNLNGGTVADIIQMKTGLFVKDYGASGALKTVSIRGTASEHVLVLIDGNRYSSFQNGLVDLSLIPLEMVERIEVLHGGSSALYGADALGGVIDILTRRANDGFHVRTEGSIGSYAFQRYSAQGQGGIGRLRLYGGYSNENGKDDYPFLFHRTGIQDTTLHRSNSDFRKQQLYLNGDLRTDEQSSISFSVRHGVADLGAPGPVFSIADLSSARQNDDDAVAQASYTDRHIEGVVISLNSAFHYGLETYVDPAYVIDSFYKNRFVTVNPQIQASLGSTDRLIVGGEFSQGILDGNDFDSRIVRVQKALYVSNEYYLSADRNYLDRASLYATYRYDHVSDVAESSTPKIGLNVRLLRRGDVRIRASYGRSFRGPSFNDLYYRGFSNPQLKPEHSEGYDVGILAGGYAVGEHVIEATWFSLRTEDRILFDPTIFLPVNIGKTTAEGIEARYSGHFFDGVVDAGVIYTLTDALKKNSSSLTDSTYNKQLLFVPRQLLKGTLSVHVGPGTVNAVYVLTGVRYTSEDNSTSLPQYGLTHANVMVVLPWGDWKAQLKAEINNIFDIDYQMFPGYPMPGRTYRLTVSLEY